MKRSHKLIVAGALLLSAIVVAGAAVGATRVFSPKQETQAVIEDAAGQLGVSPQRLSDALKQALKNRVDEAVKDGRLTKEDGAKLKESIDAGEMPLLGPGPGLGFGFRHDMVGPFGFRHDMVGPFNTKFEAAADYLGMTEAQLRQELEGGKTLAQVARDHHKSVDGLVDALLAGAEQKLEAAVQAGKLTKAEKNKILAGLRDGINDLVNGRFPAFPRFGPDVRANPFHAKLEAAAEYLGMTEAQLRQALESGKTLAQVAKDRHKSVDGLVDALLARAEQKLDAAVDAGEMTKAEKTEMMAGLKKRITDLVNGRLPEPSFRFHRERTEPRPAIF